LAANANWLTLLGSFSGELVVVKFLLVYEAISVFVDASHFANQGKLSLLPGHE